MASYNINFGQPYYQPTNRPQQASRPSAQQGDQSNPLYSHDTYDNTPHVMSRQYQGTEVSRYPANASYHDVYRIHPPAQSGNTPNSSHSNAYHNQPPHNMPQQQQSPSPIGYSQYQSHSSQPEPSYTQQYTQMPDHPPPAYNTLSSPNESQQVDQKESISSDQVHNAEEFVDQETLGWITAPRLNHQQLRMTRLQKPVVIPRIGVSGRLKGPLPFLRAYSPVLIAHDVQEEEFLAFIDNLGVAQTGSPVFKAMDVAGQVVGAVPYHWAAFAGAGIQVAAGVGSGAVSAVRTKRFLAQVNERYFAPRGLKASIKKDEDLANILFADPRSEAARQSKRNLLAPVDMQAGYMELRHRRMAALGPYIAPLTEKVLPPETQGNFLDKLSARSLQKQSKKEEKRFSKRQAKAEKQQLKMERLSRLDPRVRGDSYGANYDTHQIKHQRTSGSSDSSDSDLDSMESEMDKLDRKVQKINLDSGMSDKKRSERLAKVEEDRHKLEKKYLKKAGKVDRKAGRESEKDDQKVKRMEYIVVENL